MLRVVRDRRGFDRDEPVRATGDDEYAERVDRLAGSSRRRRKPSVAARVSLTFAVAIGLFATSWLGYVAGRSGMLNPPDQLAATATAPTSPPASQALPRPAVPDVQGLVVLIRNAVIALHQANVTGNYTVLRAIAAPQFQRQNTPAGLSEAFADLRGRGVDLSQIMVVNPRLYSDPTIDREGLLQLVGFFPVGPTKVDFELAFQTVDGRWRLFGVGLNPAGPGQPAASPAEAKAGAVAAMPDNGSILALVRGAVIALNQANVAGDYSVLRDLSAPGFQQANSPARLAAAFAALRGRQLDLGPVAVIDLRLLRPPVIDAGGYLRLAGYFPGQPEQVTFDLAFQFGTGRWQLFGIGVDVGTGPPVDAAAAPAPKSRP